jgi:SRSO17 transposase
MGRGQRGIRRHRCRGPDAGHDPTPPSGCPRSSAGNGPGMGYPSTGPGAPANPWPQQPPLRSAPPGRPADWAADEERREFAGVPDEVMFATKPQLAGDLLRHAHHQGIRAGFAAGDEVYGGLELRRSIRERGTGYVLAVRSNYMVTMASGRRITVKTAVGLLKPAMWQRMRTGSATKGARDYHWAMIEITPDDTPEGHDPGHAVLLLRRHRYTGTVSSFLCRTPGPVPLAKLVKVAVTRWRIEEDHQLSKQVSGLDSGQVTRRDQSHRDAWALWRRRHQYGARQAHQRWNAYADETPR